MKKNDSSEDLLISAFKKLDDRLKREKEEARRAEELEKYKMLQAEEEKKRKRQDLIVYSSLFVFLSLMITVVYKAESKGYFDGLTANVFNGRYTKIVDCDLSENYTLPACLVEREQQLNIRWQAMLLNNGKENPFSLKEKPKTLVEDKR